jgi:hypothetical protein
VGDILTKVYFFLTKVRDGWTVDCAGKIIGPYETREKALADAIEFAEFRDDPTISVSIIGPDEDNVFTILWSQDRS